MIEAALPPALTEPVHAGRALWLRRLGSPRGTALLAALAYLVLGWFRRWTSDDGFITLRVAGEMARGKGPVFNPGERVEASTSTGWTWLLAFEHAISRAPLPWLAVASGLVLGALGVFCLCLAAARLQRLEGSALPFGVVVLLMLPFTWDFATAGLEGGMTIGWVGVCAWLCASVGEATPRRWSWTATALGFGWWVRPDLLPAAGVLGVALLVLAPGGRRLRLVALLVLPFIALEVFRATYYAALLPNTALAKEAGTARWGQGWTYLLDTVEPYRLWVPLVVLLLVACALSPFRASGRPERVMAIALAAAGAVSIGYIVRVGGDFMHGRMLLPGLALLIAPLAVMPFGLPTRSDRSRVLTLCCAAGLAGWAVLCATVFGLSYQGIGPHGIADERGFYLTVATSAHPVTVGDYIHGRVGASIARLEAATSGGTPELVVLTEHSATGQLFAPAEMIVAPLTVGSSPGTSIYAWGHLGIAGEALGLDTRLDDILGLADPLGARLRLHVRGRPGHEKDLPVEWLVARYVAPDVPLTGIDVDPARVSAARAALACRPLAGLLRDVTGGWSFGSAWRDARAAWGNTTLRLEADPLLAQRELCS